MCVCAEACGSIVGVGVSCVSLSSIYFPETRERTATKSVDETPVAIFVWSQSLLHCLGAPGSLVTSTVSQQGEMHTAVVLRFGTRM